ncbi:pimeloyl-ACP methyl ester carboxylesterase [Thermocatellispora tengchongensis]|uniref:Pimeloyl-ACP methyl ester carboxylesterase n=1 Tax=Thermocatellispora tengchongensis TaxID=1073253 RepID=A0A840P210_9ACTN|nr:alpha/beta hydrolase [Thermocatellispora tengchongensis]MBB5133728.1 pimeloyl-ACP methyl ester carboxylesterase [Thermocatellispora tengchongensis]
MTTRKRLGALVLAGVSAVAVAVVDRPARDLAAYHHQSVTWTDCGQGPQDHEGTALDQAGARCARITVPLDYSRPAGRTITIAVSRLPASDPSRRIGTMLLNRGGPGEPTLGMPLSTRAYMGDAGSRYDLVGIDPRFVGRSTPLDCGWPTGIWIRSAGGDRAAFDRQVAFHRRLAERCARRHGDVLPHATTRNTARDLDIVRAVLGERRISYLGYSYGAYLGALYMEMFPGRTDRVVLDSPVDPARYGPRLLGREPAAERALGAWASWAAAHPRDHGLGRTRRAVLATVRHVVEAASARPLRVGPYALDEHVVPYLIYTGVGDDREENRAAFTATMEALRRAARGAGVAAPPALRQTLRFLLTGDLSHYGSPAAAIMCGDRAAPRDPETYWRDIERSRRRHPLFGPLTGNISPCAFWPHKPREAPPTIGGHHPALLVSATGDTATTYRGGQAMRRLLTGSRLLTLRDTIAHGIYGEYGDPCVDDKVNAYLETGALPATDQTCEGGAAGTP